MDGFTMALTITFENAKVTGFKVVMSAGGSLEAEMVEYTYTYNDTAVTLPSVSGNTPVNPNPGGDDDQGGEIVGGDSDCQHVWLQVSLNEGIMTYDCEKCGADKTENKTALYKNVSASIADSIYALADGKDQGASKFGASISKEEYVWEDADWSVHGINVKGVVMFVKMLSEMMSNVDFNVTSAPVKFTFSYSSSVVTEHGNAILMYTFDEENGKVTMYWLVESTVGGSTTEIFMYIDVDYDFNSNSLVGFAIEESVANEYVNMVFGYKYNANEFKYTEDENFANQIQATASVLEAELDNVIDLKADFSKEYSDMMDEMNGNQGGGDDPTPDNPNPDEPSKPVIPSAICGVYELSCLKVSSKGINLDVSVGEALPDDSGVLSVNDFVITLKDDGTYRLTGKLFTNEVITGTFEYAEGEIIFDLERIQSEVEQISVYFENQYLVFSISVPSEATTNSFYTILQGSGSGDIPVDPNPDNPNPGDKPVDPTPSQQLTEAQFNSALDIFGLSFTVEITDTEGVSGFSQAETITFIYSPSAVKIIKRGVEGESIRFYEVKNGEIFEYYQSENGWMKDCDQEWTKGVYEAELVNYTTSILKAMGLTYNSFTFDAEKGCYVYSGNIMNGISLIFNITFDSNAKLSSLNYQMSMTQEGMTYSQIFDAKYTFGAVDIQLPQDYTEEGGSAPVDPNPGDQPDDGLSAEWRALFDLENITITRSDTIVVDGVSYKTYPLLFKLDGDSFYAYFETYKEILHNFLKTYEEAWFDGVNGYVAKYEYDYNNGGFILTLEEDSFEYGPYYYDILLLDLFMAREKEYILEEVDGYKIYSLGEFILNDELIYTDVVITVVDGKIQSIQYVDPDGLDGLTATTITLSFTDYGTTEIDFSVIPEMPESPVDPEEPKPEDPDKQESFVFYVRKVSASGYEWTVGGPAPGGGTMTNTFSVLTLNADKTLTLTQQGDVIDGSWEVLGDEIFITITDGTDYETYLLKYNQETNTISYNVNGATFEYDMPENVTYEDLLGEYVDCQTFYVDKVVSGDNTFKVGDTLLNGNVLTADFVVLKVFENGLFKLTTPQTTIRGEYEIDRENGIVNAYYLEDDEPYVIEIAMSNHGATLCFDMYGITYYLNVEGYEGGEGPEMPSISSVFYVQSVIFEGETYYVGDQFLGETLSPEWATFNYFESDNTFILSYNGNVIEGSWENVDETLTQLYYTNANGEVCVIDVTLIQETKSLALTIDGYTILFDFTYSEGGDEEYVTTVTEEEFNNAIDFSRVAFQAKTWMETMYPDGDVRQEDLSVFFKDGSCLACQPIEGGVVWMYYALIDGEYHFYNSFDLVTWEEVPDYPAEMGYQQSVAFITPYGMIDMLNLTYADFTYDEECCYYVYQGEGVVTRLGFVNGQIEFVENIITQNGITKTIQSFVMHDNENIKFPTYDELVNGSEETLPEDELPSTLRVGISPDYEPFAFYDMDGQLVGFDIDLIKAVASVLGYSEGQIEFVVVDEFSSLLPGLGRGEYDIAMSGVTVTPDRAELFIYTEPYVSYFASYEDENGEIIEEWEDYVVFGYYNSSILYAIEDAINILTKEGVMDQLVEFWLGEDGKLPSETVETPEDDYVSGLEENADGDYNFSMN